MQQAILVNTMWKDKNMSRFNQLTPSSKLMHVCDCLATRVKRQVAEIKQKDEDYRKAKEKREQEAARTFTDDPLLEYKPSDTRIDYLLTTADLIKEYLKKQIDTVIDRVNYDFIFINNTNILTGK